MTTQLLRKIAEQDQAELAARYNGELRRQPKREWAVEALKPRISEEEYDAGKRAVRECIMAFPGAVSNLDRIDMAWSDASVANKVDAGHNLWGLLRAVERRSRNPNEARIAKDYTEWLVQLWTLSEIATAMGLTRFTGSPRRIVPDTRPVVPMVRMVLLRCADYYAACDVGVESWKGRIDGKEQIGANGPSCYSRA